VRASIDSSDFGGRFVTRVYAASEMTDQSGDNEAGAYSASSHE